MTDAQTGSSSGASQVWMDQWRLAALDSEGCMFVLRFLLRAFCSRRSDDDFWKFLQQFLFGEEATSSALSYERVQSAKQLLAQAGALDSHQARALMAYLSQCYATGGDRLFWNVVSEAIQLYTVAPYSGRSGGMA
jgi:hypothetical protein